MRSFENSYIRFLVRWGRNFASRLVGSFLRTSKSDGRKYLLLVRLDGIGDYILFRNFIKMIFDSTSFAEHPIVLVGNEAWKDLAESLDARYVAQFVWISRKEFSDNPIYRYKKLKEITSRRYAVAIQSTFSREFLFGDDVIRLVHADKKIGSQGDLDNITAFEKKISDQYYTQLIPVRAGVVFEFDRNREFFESVLRTRVELKRPVIEDSRHFNDLSLPHRYAVLYIGAGFESKKWAISNFVHVANYIRDRYEIPIVLCGGSTEMVDGELFEKEFQGEIYNIVGKVSLVKLIALIAESTLLVSNESNPPHMAVALGTPFVCVSNGNHLGRFSPYPKGISDKGYYVYPPEIADSSLSWTELIDKFGYGSSLNINTINPETVERAINDVLPCVFSDQYPPVSAS